MHRDVPDDVHVPFGVIITEEHYANFRFRFEYCWGGRRFLPRVDMLCDAGFLHRCHGPDKAWPDAVKCRVRAGDPGDLVPLGSVALCGIDAGNEIP